MPSHAAPKKVAFVQNITEQLFGYMYMSALLKGQGHSCEVFVNNFEDDILKALADYDPDILGYYGVTGNMDFGLDVARKLKALKPDCLTVIGGPDPTFNGGERLPDGIDAECVGEGDYVILDLADRFVPGQLSSIADIDNLRVRQGDAVRSNPLRPLVADLDSLPWPDRSVYEKYPYFRNTNNVPVMVTRGCPFNCTFCFNHVARKLYSGLGHYVRLRSPENVLAEFEALLAQRPELKYLTFVDSTLNVKNDWFVSLMHLYAQTIRLPFFCHIRVDVVKSEQIEALALANPDGVVAFGIEGGTHRLRKDVLKRDISDELILRVARELKEHGIRFGTTNIFGLPTETLEETRALIDLNRAIGVDIPTATVFQPYPGTELTQYAKDKGLLDSVDFSKIYNYYHHSVLEQKDVRTQERLHKLFFYYVKIPGLTWLWDLLAKHAPFSLLTYLFYFSAAINVKRHYGYSWLGIIRYGITNWGFYSKK